MARTDKPAAIVELKEKFEGSDVVLLTEYRGLTIVQLKTLRRAISASVQFKVAKSTPAKIAAKEAEIESLDDLLTGPTTFAFVTSEITDTAKAIRDPAKDNLALLIKGGVLEGNLLSEDNTKKLTNPKSRGVLLSKVAGVLEAALFQAAYVFQAPVSETMRIIDALYVREEATA